MKRLIRGARLLSKADGLDTKGDLLIDNGKIAALGGDLSACGAERVSDATGLTLTPGLIDLFTKANEPGTEGFEDLLSAAQAGVVGGYTGLCVHTGAKTTEHLAHLLERAHYAACDLYPSVCAVDGKDLLPYGELRTAGACAVYEDECIDNPLRMRNALYRAKKYSIPVLLRCRDRRLYAEGVIREGTMAGLLEMPFIPASAEAVAVARDLVLAQESGSAIHIGHVSTAISVELIRSAKRMGVKVTASTEPHYIALSSSALQGYNTLSKLDPPLGNPADVSALCAGLCDGTIDVLASGHTPVPMYLKTQSLSKSAPGASSLETTLAVALTTLYHSGLMSLGDVLACMTSAPAGVLNVSGGHLRVGDDADLLLLDPDREWTCRGAQFVSRGKNTPFEGRTLKGRAVCTVKAGRVAFGSLDPEKKA